MGKDSGSHKPTQTGRTLENPDQGDNRTRRPRMVNACDYCRKKKTRCIRQSGASNCEVCISAGAVCTFDDRSRYQVDRERRHASQLAPETAVIADTQPGHSTYATVGSGGSLMTSFRYDHSGTSSGMAAPAHIMDSASASTAIQSSVEQESTATYAALLFDPIQPIQPHPGLLPSLINIYYENVHPIMPIVSSECVISKYLMSSLSPVLANALAALAVPYAVTMPQFTGANLHQISLEYLSMSKAALNTGASMSSLENLCALVLIAWNEQNAGRSEEYRKYATSAVGVAHQLGFENEAIVNSFASTEDQRLCLLNLRARIIHLHQALSLQAPGGM